MPLDVRPLPQEEHLAFVTERSASFLQCPSWAGVKSQWGNESLGWYDGGRLVGAGLVLFRQIPRIPRSLAYLPEGPVVDWASYDAADITAPLLEHLRRRRAFTVKMGPQVVARRWTAETVKGAVSAGAARRLTDVTPDLSDPAAAALADRLGELGWRQGAAEGAGFGDYQPRFVFQLPLAGRTDDDLLRGFNQLWRRNVKKAAASGVVVEQGGYDDLPAFHAVYLETAVRDRFTPRALPYFQRMWRAMTGEDPDRLRLYLARQEGRVLAAATWVRVGGHVWYSYGASTTQGRELRPSNAVQWRMISDARAAGATVYDLRGIADTLDPEHPLFGLIQFKLGTGGEAVEYLGEWDYPLSPVLHRAFRLYLSRR